jgi:predicted transposase/invertase (TIGR01784 family)
MSTAVYLNPFTDYGFKRIFGQEDSKEILRDFVNSVLPERHQVASLNYVNTEHLGLNEYDRKAIVDIQCTTHLGETIIIELQKAKQLFFKDRSLYYSTFPIVQQAQKGEWNYQLQPIYMISILDFTFDDGEPTVLHTVQLKNQDNQVFYDKLSFIYLTLPYFNKTEQELQTNADKWLYLFKHMAECETVPQIYQHQGNDLFNQAFEKSRLAKLNPDEQAKYRDSLKERWDWHNILNSAKQEAMEEGVSIGLEQGEIIGLEKGKAEEKLNIARGLIAQGIDVAVIVAVTGLSAEEIKQLN